jgi:uncharacterized protein (DUF2062 family)
MPRRFFRKFAIKRHQLVENRLVAPFQHFLHDQKLWGTRRKTVVPAVAWGVFVAFLPIPGHVLVAVLGALRIRCNIPVAAVTTFISNPLTIGPMFYFSYRVGAHLLGIEPGPFAIELSLAWLGSTFVSIWQPLVLGSILVGTISAVIAYVFLDVFWRFSIGNYKARKRKGRYG